MNLVSMLVAEAAGVDKATQAIATFSVSTGGDSSPSQTEAPAIEWFKKELRISPAYVEENQGILGLSWAHFMTMVFLALFSVLALAALLIRYKRTRELLTGLLQEKKDESKN